jgi:hypothetical protein
LIDGQHAGDYYLSLFEFQSEEQWAWAAVIFNLLFTLANIVMASVKERVAIVPLPLCSGCKTGGACRCLRVHSAGMLLFPRRHKRIVVSVIPFSNRAY